MEYRMTLGRILFEAAGLWADADWTRDAMGLAYGKLADAAATNGGPSIDDPDDVETQRYRDWACDVLDCNHPALADMDVTIRTHMIPARIGLPSVRSVWNDKPTVGVFNSRFEIAVGVECELWDGRTIAHRAYGTGDTMAECMRGVCENIADGLQEIAQVPARD
jgi:hypothetical protein